MSSSLRFGKQVVRVVPVRTVEAAYARENSAGANGDARTTAAGEVGTRPGRRRSSWTTNLPTRYGSLVSTWELALIAGLMVVWVGAAQVLPVPDDRRSGARRHAGESLGFAPDPEPEHPG